jgi:hypothetical protein
MALINIRDDPVRDKAISSVSNALKSGKHPLTGQFLKDKRLPEKTIKKVIQQVEQEIRGELTEKYKAEKKPADIDTIINAVEDEAIREKVAAYRDACIARGEPVYANDIREYIKMVTNPPVPVVIQTLAQQQAVKESPFQTAAEVLAHDRDPLGVGDMFRAASLKDCEATVKDTLTVQTPADAAKVQREEMERRAVAFVEMLSSPDQLLVKDIIRDHGDLWKAKDVLVIGIRTLAEKKPGRKA